MFFRARPNMLFSCLLHRHLNWCFGLALLLWAMDKSSWDNKFHHSLRCWLLPKSPIFTPVTKWSEWRVPPSRPSAPKADALLTALHSDYGASWKTQTSDLFIRSELLYSTELKKRHWYFNIILIFVK